MRRLLRLIPWLRVLTLTTKSTPQQPLHWRISGMLKTLLTCATLSLTLCACVTRPVVSVPPARCSGLVPAAWQEPVPGTPVPAARAPRVVPSTATPLERVQAAAADALDALRDYAGAFVAESGQREKANGRTADTIAIVSGCETLINGARPGGGG